MYASGNTAENSLSNLAHFAFAIIIDQAAALLLFSSSSVRSIVWSIANPAVCKVLAFPQIETD